MSNHNDKNELNSGKLLTILDEDNPEPSQICIICKQQKPYKFFHKNKTNRSGHDTRCKECKKKEANIRRYENYFMEYLRTKRGECKKKDIIIDLTPDYLENIWTGICPIFNTKISFNYKGRGSGNINQAHLDRINPNKGYIKENVCWISGRANRIKYNATIKELEQILTYMKGATTILNRSTL